MHDFSGAAVKHGLEQCAYPSGAQSIRESSVCMTALAALHHISASPLVLLLFLISVAECACAPAFSAPESQKEEPEDEMKKGVMILMA